MLLRKITNVTLKYCSRNVHYIQGQSPEQKIREYFYYIDHQGQLFLDDSKMKNFTSCFKEKKFLEFFFKKLRLNETERYAEEFPYLSPCGRERNYIRCDDRPIVFIHLLENEQDILSYGCLGANLTVQFHPEKVCMLPETGRIYHPADPTLGGVGLIKSSIAIAISKYFDFDNGEDCSPTHFTWKGIKYPLTNELLPLMKMLPSDARSKLEEFDTDDSSL